MNGPNKHMRKQRSQHILFPKRKKRLHYSGVLFALQKPAVFFGKKRLAANPGLHHLTRKPLPAILGKQDRPKGKESSTVCKPLPSFLRHRKKRTPRMAQSGNTGAPLELQSSAPRGQRYEQKEEWRTIAPHSLGLRRLNLWILVLEARNYPFRIQGKDGGLEVLASVAEEAQEEIREFESEEKDQSPVLFDKQPLWPVYLLLFFLFFLHGVRYGWFPFGPFFSVPNAALWPQMFGLDPYRILHRQEWWRTATALFVHKDSAHLLGNLAFSFVFLPQLCRRSGNGAGLCVTLAGGILGNVANAVFRSAGFLSMGFSTSVFAIIGGMGIYGCFDSWQKSHTLSFSLVRSFLLPLAAGVALLALLGGAEKESTDFAAHVFGFFSGIFWGGLLAVAGYFFAPKPGILGVRWQWSLGLFSFLFCLCSWIVAW